MVPAARPLDPSTPSTVTDPRPALPGPLALLVEGASLQPEQRRALEAAGFALREGLSPSEAANCLAQGSATVGLLGGAGEWVAELERLGEVGSFSYQGPSAEFALSDQAVQVLGLDSARLSLADLFESIDPEHRERFAAWCASSGDGRRSIEVGQGGSGAPRRMLRWTRQGSGALAAGFVQDVSERWLTDACAANSQAVDPLTGLPTRNHFLDQVARGLIRTSRRKHRLAVLVFHLEPLPGAQGSPSEAQECAMLLEASERLRRSLRDQDVLARIAGDPGDISLASADENTFLLLLELQRTHDSSNVGRRLMEVLSRPMPIAGTEFSYAVTGGIALHPDDGLVPEELIERASAAAEAAREEGAGSLQYFCTNLNTAAFEKLSLESALRGAVDGNQLVLFYQPKVEIATERIVGYEALVRWRHPELGMVSPAQFIPLAEETGMIIPIGRWVLQQACRDAKAWQTAGLPPIRMAVNLSSVQFREPQLFEWVMQSLAEAELDPQWLELELTESMLMHDVEAAVTILRRLKAEGIHISIDDFGTGYSSLAYLKRFPIDSLKIDRSFIREINTNPDDAAISTSIILMGRSLKLRVIAEGVETRSQLAFLRVMQCDEAQGFLFSQPVPEPRAKALLEAQVRPPAGKTAGDFQRPSSDAA